MSPRSLVSSAVAHLRMHTTCAFPSASARPKGERRIHGAALPCPSPPSAGLRRRESVVARDDDRPGPSRATAMERKAVKLGPRRDAQCSLVRREVALLTVIFGRLLHKASAVHSGATLSIPSCQSSPPTRLSDHDPPPISLSVPRLPPVGSRKRRANASTPAQLNGRPTNGS